MSASRFRLTSELRSEDFPTLDLPTSANSGIPSEGQSPVVTLLFTNSEFTTSVASPAAYLLSTIFEPFKILAPKLEISRDDTSVSGGTKRVSRESGAVSWGCDGAAIASEKWEMDAGMGLDTMVEVISRSLLGLGQVK